MVACCRPNSEKWIGAYLCHAYLALAPLTGIPFGALLEAIEPLAGGGGALHAPWIAFVTVYTLFFFLLGRVSV